MSAKVEVTAFFEAKYSLQADPYKCQVQRICHSDCTLAFAFPIASAGAD